MGGQADRAVALGHLRGWCLWVLADAVLDVALGGHLHGAGAGRHGGVELG